MLPLTVLGLVLLALWAFGVWERDGRARFMRGWLHAPLLAAAIVLVMALGLAVR